MAYGVYNGVVTDTQGNVVPNVFVEVRSEATGELAVLFSDRNGETTLGNPFTTLTDGLVTFFTVGGAYQIKAKKDALEQTWRYVAIGTAQEYDAEEIDRKINRDGDNGIKYLTSDVDNLGNGSGKTVNLNDLKSNFATIVNNGVITFVAPTNGNMSSIIIAYQDASAQQPVFNGFTYVLGVVDTSKVNLFSVLKIGDTTILNISQLS